MSTKLLEKKVNIADADIHFRINHEIKEHILQAAEKKGFSSPAAYVKYLIMRELESEGK